MDLLSLIISFLVPAGASVIIDLVQKLLKKKDKAQTLYCVTPGCTYTFNKDDAGEKDGE